jgi:dienelactone hydrolase
MSTSLYLLQAPYLDRIYTGTKTGVYTDTTITYASSIDEEFNALQALITYDSGLYNCPILVLNHGWSSTMGGAFPLAVRQKFASYGFFVIAPNLRGGPNVAYRDASAREIYDIYDVVQYVRANYSTRVSSSRAGQSGYSGGGGNALATALKFPDLFDFTVSNFGPSDYGYTASGWYYTDTAFQSDLNTSIGGTPITTPNNYRSRNSREGINNYTGKIFLFHDELDASVDVVQSRNLYSAFNDKSRIYYNESNASSAERWLHDHPYIGGAIEKNEKYWKNYIFSISKRYIPIAGTHEVRGYNHNSRYKILLGNLDDHAATCVYNCSTGVFIVTPLTGEQSVSITFEESTQTQTINTETTFSF